MCLAIDRSRHWIVTFSLTGASFIAGCGGGAETPAPVANQPAPAAAPAMNNPQAMMMSPHGQHGVPAATPAMPGTTPTANDPAAAMRTPMAAHNGGTANPTNTLTPPPGAAANPQMAAHAAHRASMANPAAVAGVPNPAAAHAGGTAAPVTNLNPAAAAAFNPATAHAGGTAAPGGNAPGLPEAHVGANPGATPLAPNPAAAHATPSNAPAALAGTNAAEAMAANQAAGNAGTLGAAAELAGGPGGNPQGGPGGANAVTGEPGSIEYAITKLVSMAKAGDYAGAEAIISEKAKGLAADFRDQDLKPTQIESYKTTFDGMQALNRRAAGGNGVQFTFKKGETTIQITLNKEAGGAFKIKELQIRDKTK